MSTRRTVEATSANFSVLLAVVWYMPESPRWLVKVGRDDEARFILGRLRGEDEEGLAEAEFQDIKNICKLEQENSQQDSYISMLFGIKQGKLHTARRVQLVVWLQILQEWIGIAGSFALLSQPFVSFAAHQSPLRLPPMLL